MKVRTGSTARDNQTAIMYIPLDGYVAMHDYEARDSDEVSFVEGDFFKDVRIAVGVGRWGGGGDMRRGRRRGRSGSFGDAAFAISFLFLQQDLFI